jgi:transcriptional regulator with XRE-family HTH domain
MLTMFSTRQIRLDILRTTQAGLARCLDIDQATVSRWENAEAKGEAVDTRTQLAIEALAMKFPNGLPASESPAA